jgi:hypothetical protein
MSLEPEVPLLLSKGPDASMPDTKPYEIEYYKASTVDQSYTRSFASQLTIMLKRNLTLQLRSLKSTLAQSVVAPFLFMLVLYVLQLADYSNQGVSLPNPLPSTLQGVYRCTGLAHPCINIMYSPNTAPFNAILSSFSQKNAVRTGETAFQFSSSVSGILNYS